MILVDNIVFMKERFPLIWEAYREYEDRQEEALAVIEPSKAEGYPTLAVNKNDRTYYIHSRYNPGREVGAVLDNFDGQAYEHVIFYGIGLGYHITEFLNRFPHLSFSIYEPVPEVFKAFLTNFKLKDLLQLGLQEIVVENSAIDAKAFLERIVKRQKNILFLDLPSYKTIFPDEYTRFVNLFKDIVRNRRSSLATDFTFEKRWIINSLLNFKEVLNTPNIIVEKAGAFKNKPAILVAAGPSLDYEIENLRYIKENGLAYIFSVGSAVDSLIGAGIYPHAQCTYDPGEDNQSMVFARITEEKIADIPLIFGSTVAHEVLANYPGQHKLHMITSQDTISSYLLKLEDESHQLNGVMDAPSIAIVTLQLLYKLGFNPIILVGQNLAYEGKKLYADNIPYWQHLSIDSEPSQKLIKIKDVEGNDVYTNIDLNGMRINMEFYINLMSETKIINTTRGGANIAGTEFRELRDLIENKVLDGKIVEADWYNIPATNYDYDYMRKQFKKLNKDYELLKVKLYNLLEVLGEINKLKESRNSKKLEKMWGSLDKALSQIQNNRFFDKVIIPMNRISYEILVNQTPNIRFETDVFKKAELIVEVHGRLARASLADWLLMEEIMGDMKELVGKES